MADLVEPEPIILSEDDQVVVFVSRSAHNAAIEAVVSKLKQKKAALDKKQKEVENAAAVANAAKARAGAPRPAPSTKKKYEEKVVISPLESLEACRFPHLDEADEFHPEPGHIVKVIKPLFQGDVEPAGYPFTWRYHVQFNATLSKSDQESTGIDVQTITVELPDEHLASAIAFINPSRQGPRVLGLPLPSFGGGSKRQWTKVQPLVERRRSGEVFCYVERINSAVKVVHQRRPVLVPFIDFRAAPSIDVRRSYTADYKIGNKFFVYKPAAYASLQHNLDADVFESKSKFISQSPFMVHASEEDLLRNRHTGHLIDDSKLKSTMEALQPEYVLEIAKKVDAEMLEQSRMRTAPYDLSQYSERTFTLLDFDHDRKLAALRCDGPIDLISLAAPRAGVVAGVGIATQTAISNNNPTSPTSSSSSSSASTPHTSSSSSPYSSPVKTRPSRFTSPPTSPNAANSTSVPSFENASSIPFEDDFGVLDAATLEFLQWRYTRIERAQKASSATPAASSSAPSEGGSSLSSSADEKKPDDFDPEKFFDEEFDVFHGPGSDRVIIVHADYLASVLIQLDEKWRRAHPFQDMEKNYEPFITLKDDGSGNKDKQKFGMVFLYDPITVNASQLMIVPNVHIRREAALTDNSSSCSIM